MNNQQNTYTCVTLLLESKTTPIKLKFQEN